MKRQIDPDDKIYKAVYMRLYRERKRREQKALLSEFMKAKI